ncbi:uncharacterized protein LOC132704621 [Cylas formicarius]|uniref:uncharacterized protein LOC132704621 n=1 Tax=Cylas formicarius TaxID=197179 RepID=UPI002958AD9A|nr:uncharacterized protein LOC132704621 [Cylas formicarius]XP_060530720.1 uncharacterized protein LOC132704621 [Cylas formicarius]XP_060530721.1 uncharacterized protein LOC132704621 [Cylas formicarius]
MPVKQWFQKLQPVQLYIVLTFTVAFFLTELVVSHLTHALTLLMDSYHMLCNIMALTGCIITIKYGSEEKSEGCDLKKAESESSNLADKVAFNADAACRDKKNEKSSPLRANKERKLKNTFGWTRIDVITMLICCVFLASFCFSIYVEALQTLTHIDHQDEMHHPISVLFLGATGFLLNGACYLLIGGYTFHQGSFLYVTESGDVILNKVVVNESVQRGQRRLSRTRNIYSSPPRNRQGLWEMARDIAGCFFVMVGSVAVIFTDKEIAKYIDPALSLLSATAIMVLSVPYIKESCLILLQTMPDTINIDFLKAELVTHFPDIINVHDFHVWQLTASKVISTVHIIFENPKVYKSKMEEIKEFFLESGVTQVTIQPEFFSKSASVESLHSGKVPPKCLVACSGELCRENHCCPSNQELDKLISGSKEVLPIPEKATPTLKSVKILQDELPSLRSSINSIHARSSSSSNSKSIDDDTVKEERGYKSDDVTGRNENVAIGQPCLEDSETEPLRDDTTDGNATEEIDTKM